MKHTENYIKTLMEENLLIIEKNRNLKDTQRQLENEINELKKYNSMLKNEIINLKNKIAYLEEIAYIDTLTNVGNRRSLEGKENITSVIICDMDQLKKINDTFGHAAGDEAIKTFANVLKNNTRASDIIRYGGDEFVIVLENCTSEDAVKKAEKIREEIEMVGKNIKFLRNENNENELGLTASIGVYTGDEKTTLEEKIAFADEAEKYSKQNGKNMVTVYNTISKIK